MNPANLRLDGRIVLITGGTGSFGSTFVNRLMTTEVSEIRIFSRDEKKQEDMRLSLNESRLKFFIGDVRSYESIHHALKDVDYVFSAAALKQVPSCEFFPLEAVRTNALGAENVMNAAIAQNVRRVVVLSTDKAVYPINAMGLSKAMMEKLMTAKARQQRGAKDTVFCGTRYGNVMASRGSVIPLFVEQLKAGKPLSITDPNMTRFLMSLPDSVDLVLHAFAHGQQGDIFVPKAPSSTIGDLAQALKELFNKDNPIQIIGTRHGEKLYESLVSREEMAKAEHQDQYYRIPADNRDLNYNQYVIEGETKITQCEDYTSHNTERLNIEQIKVLLSNLDYIQAEMNA